MITDCTKNNDSRDASDIEMFIMSNTALFTYPFFHVLFEYFLFFCPIGGISIKCNVYM